MYSQIFIIIAIILSMIFIMIIISIIERKAYSISTFAINTKKVKGKIRIVFISDFHDKKDRNACIKIIDDIINLNPSYIVLGGDFVDFSTIKSKFNNVCIDNAIYFIENLSKKTKEKLFDNNDRIYFAFGNHELRLKDRESNMVLRDAYERFMTSLKNNGINILDDMTYDISDNITISGFNLYYGYYKHLFSKIKLKENIDKEIINNSFSSIDKNKYNIMVFHKPDYCEDFIEFGFDLVLSGHNHGGLVRFPVIGAIVSPDLKFHPKYNDGMYEIEEKHVIVSRGIGEHFIKLRVNNRPEICVIDINGTNNL